MTRGSADRERLVVVGNGMAAARLVEELLARDAPLDITVVGEEPGASKVTKAETLGVPMVDAAGFEALLEAGELPEGGGA